MRPVFLEFPEDPNTAYLDKEYMFGSKLLVAPVFNDQGKVHFYIPEGKWTSLLNEKRYVSDKNGQWVDETFDHLNLPLLVRGNSILLRKPNVQHADYDYTDAPDINLYEIEDGEVSTAVVDHLGNTAGSVTVERKGNNFKVSATGLHGDSTINVHENGVIKTFTLSGSNTSFSL
ncbi:hypothetical protein [Furfurilactobacillus cerevisiae]